MKPKAHEGKYTPHLLSRKFLEEVARVREYGVKKYGHEDGWQITPDIEYIDAALRHCLEVMEAMKKKDPSLMLDAESGLHHAAHAACDLMFILSRGDYIVKKDA